MRDGYIEVYKRPKTLLDKRMHYCPGCMHAIVHKLVAELIEEMDLQSKAIGICPVGCSVFAYDYIDIDWQEAAHGRAAAIASAVKRVRPENMVFTYQGDGDLAAIGLAETMHACNRGEDITIIFINNGIYGMTGGQMAPTTLEGDKTTTSPRGRDVASVGAPLKMCEMVSQLQGIAYAERVSCNNAANVRKTKRAIKKAFSLQDQKLGTCFVEVISNCPSGWKCSPTDSILKVENESFEYFPLGVYKDITKK